jgi:Peptidase family M28
MAGGPDGGRLLSHCKIGIFLGIARYACIFTHWWNSEAILGRIGLLAALVAGIWLLSAYGQSRPDALGLDAPATQFSAARADAVLGRVLGDQRPHPAGSVQAQAVRARILKELTAMGVQARTQTGMSCYRERRWSVLPCGTITNIVAGVSSGVGKAILLMAHTDSVAAGPGAADDGSGVAILLETIRALKTRGLQGEHPIIALFTDGEEPGLLGAAAYLRNPMLRDGIGAVINVEARGNQGPSYLFQTSAGNSRLIGLYANSVAHYATSSLYGEIYKYLPNDTDLTPMLAVGVPGYNFAFIGNIAHYHTPLDRRENIDRRSLQQQGEAALALTDTLANADLAALKGRDAIYLDVLGRWLPRIDARWALPLSVAAFVLIALAGLLTRRGRRVPSRLVLAAAMPPLLLAGCIGMGFLLHTIASWLSSHADPSFAHPIWLRLALCFGAFAVALAVSRWSGGIACWLWFAGLAIVCAVLAPGLTPYFLFPSLVAAPLLLATVRGGREPALFVAALAALIIWIGLNASGEAIMGLKMHPLFMASAGFGLLALLPLLGRAQDWKLCFAASLGLAFVLTAVAGLQPAYSSRAPERLNLRYVENQGKAFWLADPVTHLPDGLRAVVNFSALPQRLLEMGYVAAAGPARNPAPAALTSRSGDSVTLDLRTAGDGIMLVVPAEAMLQSLTIGGVTTAMPGRRVSIVCATPDCATARMTLRLASPKAVELLLVELRRGLPRDGEKLLKARPAEAVPSQIGDSTMLAAKLAIPAR